MPAPAKLTGANLSIQICNRFQFSCEAYKSLLAASSATVFQHPEWLDTFYEILVPYLDAQPRIVVIRADNLLLGVIPFLTRSVDECVILEFAHGGVSDYVCPILHADLVADSNAMEQIALQLQTLLEEHDALFIDRIPQHSAALWRRLLKLPTQSSGISSHMLLLNKPYTQWRRDTFSSNRRQQLGRKRRRLSQNRDLAFRIAEPPTIAARIRTLRDFREDRFPGDPLYKQSPYDFYRTIAQRGQRQDMARTFELVLDDEVIAVCFGLVNRNTFLFLLLGGNYKDYGDNSPGTLMLESMIQHWIATGGSHFDLTIGDEPYKKIFRPSPSPVFHIYHGLTSKGEQLIRRKPEGFKHRMSTVAGGDQ